MLSTGTIGFIVKLFLQSVRRIPTFWLWSLPRLKLPEFLLHDADIRVRVLATATCLSGWLGVCHSRYCIKTTKPILKLFRPSGSPIIEAFGIPCADTKFQGEPIHRGYIYTRGYEKLEIFDGNCRLSRKQCKIGRWLLWNVNISDTMK